MTRILSVFNLLKRVGFALLLLGVITNAALADTTWVSGQVGGVWDQNGSPYIVVGSAWVDPAVGLTVRGGTNIELPNVADRLELRGRVEFQGTSELIIQIWLANNYCLFSQRAQTSAIRMDHVWTNGLGGLLLRADSIFIESCRLENTLLHGDWGNFNYLSAGVATIRNSLFHAIYVYNATTEVRNCEFTRLLDLSTGAVTIDSLHWIPSGIVEDGKVNWSPNTNFAGTVINNSSARRFVGNCTIEPLTTLLISNCMFSHGAEFHYTSNTTINNSQIGNLVAYNLGGIIQGCILRGGRISSDIYPLTLSNNTLIYDSCCAGEGVLPLLSFGGDLGIIIENNIFYSTDSRSMAIYGFNQALLNPRYNITYGMSDPWGGHQVDDSNIDINPEFDPNDSLFSLLPTSPAINAGNTTLFDDDGTRSDIGARWWDHRFDHAPIIQTPNHIVTKWGDYFTFGVSAVDEAGVRLLVDIASPAWFLFPRHLDDTYARLFEGYVPFGVESFDLEVVAIDEHDQRDHERIHVQVNPASVLPAHVSGVLTAEHSPYIAYQDVIIGQQDSLIVQAGTTIEFSSELCTPQLATLGSFITQGTEEQPVRLQSADLNSWYGIVGGDSSAVLRMTHTSVSGCRSVCRIDPARTVSFDYCSFENHSQFQGGVTMNRVEDTVRVNSCTFDSSTRLGIGSSKIVIDSCVFSGMMDGIQVSLTACDGVVNHSRIANTGPHSAVSIYNGNIEMYRCDIHQTGNTTAQAVVLTNGARPDPTHLEISHCTFRGLTGIGLSHSNSWDGYTMNSSIRNTIFEGQTGQALRFFQMDGEDVTMNNNCFDVGNTILSGLELPEFRVLNSINIIGDSIDSFGNIFLDPVLSDSGTISSESPCIDAGLNIGEPFIGLAPDIGANEYIGAFPPAQASDEPPASTTTVSPNPFNPTTTLSFSLPKSSLVELTVYDVLGRVVMSREFGILNAGVHDVAVDGAEWSSGVYFASVSAGEWREVVKMALLR